MRLEWDSNNTVPELFFGKKRLIPALQQLMFSYSTGDEMANIFVARAASL